MVNACSCRAPRRQQATPWKLPDSGTDSQVQGQRGTGIFSSKWFAGRTGVCNCCPIVRSRDAVQVKQLTCLIFKALIEFISSSQSMAALFIPAYMWEACQEWLGKTGRNPLRVNWKRNKLMWIGVFVKIFSSWFFCVSFFFFFFLVELLRDAMSDRKWSSVVSSRRNKCMIQSHLRYRF